LSARLHRPPSQAELALAVSEWNHLVAVGDEVEVTMDDRSVFKTRTRSEAQILGGHSAVVCLDGIAGAYSLNRVRPI
jgi:hypothetical protein